MSGGLSESNGAAQIRRYRQQGYMAFRFSTVTAPGESFLVNTKRLAR